MFLGLTIFIAALIPPPAVLGVIATTREGHHTPGGTQ